jgi:hypothetical protein
MEDIKWKNDDTKGDSASYRLGGLGASYYGVGITVDAWACGKYPCGCVRAAFVYIWRLSEDQMYYASTHANNAKKIHGPFLSMEEAKLRMVPKFYKPDAHRRVCEHNTKNR